MVAVGYLSQMTGLRVGCAPYQLDRLRARDIRIASVARDGRVVTTFSELGNMW